jgi:hypothetical protein
MTAVSLFYPKAPAATADDALAVSIELNLRLEAKLREVTADAMRLAEERDDALAELAKTSTDFSSVWESRDEVIEERERARRACNTYWHDLTRIALLCAQTDDEYPLKAVERTVREFAQSRRDFVRVADALGLVGTDDAGRIGAIASVEDIVAQARHAAKALSREQPVAEEER